MRVLVLRRPIVWGQEAVRRVAAPTGDFVAAIAKFAILVA